MCLGSNLYSPPKTSQKSVFGVALCNLAVLDWRFLLLFINGGVRTFVSVPKPTVR